VLGRIGMLVLGAAVLAGCGAKAQGPQSAQPRSPTHMHGLAIDPVAGTLVVAAHEGMFGVSEDRRRLVPVGRPGIHLTAVSSDALGLIAIGDLRDGGGSRLLTSQTSGNRWSPGAAAVGRAVRASGRAVAALGPDGRTLRLSLDGGRAFARRDLPIRTSDVLLEPRRLLIAGSDGIFESRDRGGTWRRASHAPTRALVGSSPGWTFGDGGAVARDGRLVGRVPGRPLAAEVDTAGTLYVLTQAGSLLASADGGRTWRSALAPGEPV
jgi:hypothetical protein